MKNFTNEACFRAGRWYSDFDHVYHSPCGPCACYHLYGDLKALQKGCQSDSLDRIQSTTMPIVSNHTEVQSLAQQIIAEMSFSFHPNDNGSKRAPNAFKGRFDNERLAADLTISSRAKETTISSISFGERIDGSFQLLTDENGLSWWYDTSKRTPVSSSR